MPGLQTTAPGPKTPSTAISNNASTRPLINGSGLMVLGFGVSVSGFRGPRP